MNKFLKIITTITFLFLIFISCISLSKCINYQKSTENILSKEIQKETDTKILSLMRQEKEKIIKEQKEKKLKKEKEEILFKLKEEDKNIDSTTFELYYGKGTLEERINNFLEKDINNVAYLYHNINTNETISLNADKPFTAASTYKLHLNILIYNKINNGIFNENTVLSMRNYQNKPGNRYINFKQYYQDTNIIKVLDDSIITSDNTAAFLLYHTLGGWNSYRNEYFNFFNIENRMLQNETTVNNELIVLKYLYEHQDEYSHLITSLKNTIYHDRLDKYIPNEIVAHKIGTLDTILNDVGIVYTQNPYIVCVLTDSCNKNQYEIIAKISRAIYIYNLTN